jgi:small-conductance mechanosensitive channel
VLDLLRSVFVLILAIVLSLGVSGLIEHRLLRSATGDVNARVVVGKLIRAVFLLVGILVALSVVGIDLTVLSVFGGALGVGIGLGLQKLASNYIAGFAILLDRSVRIGDMITVDNRTGIVTKATARYVVVHSLDNFEAIVPNEVLVTTTVINHSYTSWETRVGVPVQISYDSDLDLALRLMEEAATAEPRILQAPSPPKAFVNRFAEHGIDLELVVWIKDPENGQQNLRSSLNRRIWSLFGEHSVQISVPQREIRVVGGGEAPGNPGSNAPAGTSRE